MNLDIQKLIDTATLWVSEYAFKILAAVLILIIGKWLAGKISNLVSKLLEKNKVDITLVKFFDNIIYYTLMIAVIIAAAGQLGINTTSFLTVVGAAGLAIGLALKDSLSNFASGVMLIMFRPFRVGDFVSAGGATGKVVSISLFNTILNTPDNQRVIVPNSAITAAVITNVTANDTRRVDLVISISYDDDIRKAKQILSTIINEDKRTLDDPAPTVAVMALADSSVNFAVRPWVKTAEYWDVYFDLTEKIKLAFDKEGITIPYPQTDVHIFNQTAE
ncbi:MAG: mechanosensitive ion channel [Proteobacteria bacterium]|nr:mechanosensitive ion channel [Pseudomonadota bacterium]MBU1389081.1 mechanosensitive ion channel [Pseudomonadota bacterium]MBU1543634.1 mechanosensitive ion channel [Pseudomonadota bacterium]MBU2429437.1 mechanosensitive ion channel [Pseudomonadota bacterium]MBU2479838.1 mechanosensitive ion channel [Pseudomonadota bacterium]